MPKLRHYLMCPPTYFDVTYSINPWMDPSGQVDRALAVRQWSGLVDAYRSTGHRVDLLEPLADLPDMVYAANGATVVDGQTLPARFANPEREAEAAAHSAWHRRNSTLYGGGDRSRQARSTRPRAISPCCRRESSLAIGFRTTLPAHHELATLTGREVISLELVDPRLFHLDLALAVLDDQRDHIAYYPGAFSQQSRRLLGQLFPDALIATEHDAYAFGLNAVSDGLHVFIPAGARQLRELLAAAGYWPISVDLSELIKGGGSVKCCTQEIRPAPSAPLVPIPTPRQDLIVITTQDHDHLTHATASCSQIEDEHVAHNYHPLDVVVSGGSGAVLTDTEGRALPGLPSGVLGHELRALSSDAGRRRQGAARAADADLTSIPS